MFNLLKKPEYGIKNVNEIVRLLGKIELIDIREEKEFAVGSIRGAKNIPMNKLLSQPEKFLNKDKEYYIMCHSGMRSTKACEVLNKMGYRAINVLGGYLQYKNTK